MATPDYTRDFSTGEVFFKGRWYDGKEDLEAAEAEYEADQDRKAEFNREERNTEVSHA